MKTGLVKCPSCNKEVSPRLWHENISSNIYRRKTLHLCPLCGKTMYTSGGGLTGFGMLIAFIFVIPLLIAFIGKLISSIFEYIGFSRDMSEFIAVCLMLLVLIKYLSSKYPSFNQALMKLKNLFGNKET
jgi:ribosomal protein S27E